jgi:hypothetical protein
VDKFSQIKDYFFNKAPSLLTHKQNTNDNRRYRNGLVVLNKIMKNYGHINQYIYDPYSSGEESDMDTEKINEATIKDVYMNLKDNNTIYISVNIFFLFFLKKTNKEIPSEVRPALIFTNIDDWVNDNYMKIFIEDIPILS